GVVAGGFGLLHRYEATPGPVTIAPSSWPASSRIKPATDRPTLLLFAHPQCPCTRATIDELAQVMCRGRGKVAAHVLFYKPTLSTSTWEESDIWQAASLIPGVGVSIDLDGVEAARFSAHTSGHALLFSREGKLLFS